ncbi:MOXD1 homolog 1-like [Nilaparvata lugens]|uniref:MOXD1 homolog 1-like n=1 Tax=Nilaparvata lugens TaxID=108931 RepID=UPI00193D6C02|nr:MOXD1 homolog 1-like [Nilaparvata lugens]
MRSLPLFPVCALFPLFAVAFASDNFISSTDDNIPEWTHSLMLTDSTQLSWSPRDEDIVFKLETESKGMVCLGFSTSDQVVGADVLVAWVDDVTGKVHVKDCHATQTSLEVDLLQNFELINGYKNETHAVIIFKRIWDTCDKNDVILGPDTIRLLWTVHDKEEHNLLQTSTTLKWHGKKWNLMRSVHLISPPAIRKPKENNVKHWDITLDNFAVPDNMDTYYWCKIFKVPPLGKKHHMIGYEPILSAGSGSLVHHMLLYECVGAHLEMYTRHEGSTCYVRNMPTDWDSCLSPVVAWAIGSKGEFYHDLVGLPLAEDNRSTYFMLEIHYDNPTFSKVHDSSGLRLYYTENLREYDGGILISGVTVSPLHIIPPRQPQYKTAGYCDGSCTKLMLPARGIKVVSVLLHSHLAGRKIILRHIRDGVELPAIAKDENYDFNYQQSRVIEEGIRVLPGDELITECVYETTNRTQPTHGGYSTKQEMCLAFIVYYPRTPLASCLSMSPVEFFFKTFGVTEFYNYNMSTVEKMFLKLTENQVTKPQPKSTTPPTFPKFSDDDVFDDAANQAAIRQLQQMADFTVEEAESGSLLGDLVIRESHEFANKTFIAHLQNIPWHERILTQRIQDALNRGKHMTFCRLNDDTLAMSSQIYNFPNFTELASQRQNNESKCINEVELQPQQTEENSAAIPSSAQFTTIMLTVILIRLL